jgi:hypothetical protein
MFDHRPTLIAARNCMLAVCLALLAGCGAADESASSGVATAPAQASTGTPLAPDPTITTPAVPTGLAATAADAQASLTWSTSSGATSYHVKRATASGGPYSQVGAPTSAAYSDTSVTKGTKYYYVVSAVDAAGESANSEQVSALPAAASTAIPAVPSAVSATSGDGQVTLRWSTSSGATSYHVKRATTSGGPYSQVGAPTSASYTDSAVTNGTMYYYVVSAISSAAESANSAQVSALPAVPTSNPPPTTLGTWINVTPAGVDLTNYMGCGNYGFETVQVDPKNPSNLYAALHCQGIWKSTNYGATWTGPINTGTNGAKISDCAGGITIPPSSTASVPTIYESCIRGSGLGFWKSVDGGVNWTSYFVPPGNSGYQDFYPPVVDPHDENHLLMATHEQNYLRESVDGGHNWTNVPMAGGMMQNGGTGEIFFINTGNAASTRGLWLWLAQASGGTYGTWRTSNSGATWVKVDKNEHPHGVEQIYQPDNNGVVFMAGSYSDLGNGVLRSTDYGQTWTHVGSTASGEGVVTGSSTNLYSMFGYPIGVGGTTIAAFEIGAQPGTGTWVTPNVPAGLTQGPGQIRVVNDGTHNILVAAMHNAGLWRYIEP